MHASNDNGILQSITMDKAQFAVTQAVELARSKFSRPICVSICDAYGLLLAFSRMDGTPLRCINIAQQKAYTSVRMGSSTAAFKQRLVNEGVTASDFCDESLTPLAGGQPIKNAMGVIIAGVGISGLKPEEDDALASEIVALL